MGVLSVTGCLNHNQSTREALPLLYAAILKVQMISDSIKYMNGGACGQTRSTAMSATRTTCWTCEKPLKDWERAVGKGQCEDCQTVAEEQAERDSAAEKRESERRQRANWNAVAPMACGRPTPANTSARHKERRPAMAWTAMRSA